MLSFQRIASITKGKVLSAQQDTIIHNYIFDSRKASHVPNAMFLAIKGRNNDGHNFINELYKSGIRNFIVESMITPPVDANVLLVDNTIEAIQQIAAFYRSQFSFPVLGITGSNGKTILKEWLSQSLSRKYNLVKSPKSYNSQLGVPLSVLQIGAENNFGIFEAGISKFGEMEKLEKIIKPTIGLFTNLGPAHDEGFADRDQKSREKWKLFSQSEFVVYCKDHKTIDLSKPKEIRGVTWGETPEADVVMKRKRVNKDSTEVELIFRNYPFNFELPFADKASVENGLHLAALYLQLGYEEKFIGESLAELKSVPMRLEVKRGINQTTIIDDTYNNDLAGLQSALEFLNGQSRNRKKVLILSDIIHSGNEKGQPKELVSVVNNSGVDRLYAVGPELQKIGEQFIPEKSFYTDTSDFLNNINSQNFFGEFVLIKGARPFQFEKITRFFSEKVHGTKLEINLDALSHNLNFYKTLLNPGVRIMVMVKAFAYGIGSAEVANLLQFHNADYLAVAYADEGVELRKQGISSPIMVMNAAPASFEKLIEYRLEPEIFSQTQLKNFCDFLDKKQASCGIHLKIDTGMKRLGFEVDEIDSILSFVKASPPLKVVSVFTHLAASDDENHNAFSLRQLGLFQNAMQKIKDRLEYAPLFHALNSPGIVRFPDYQFDMVRLGIGLYGYESCGIFQDKLRPIGTLKTEISQLKTVKKGESIGYGRRGRAGKDATIAVIAIGYADGFNRAFSNGKIAVSVRNKPAPVIGNICMDMSMVDVTGIDAEEGDEVIIFGENPTIQDLANAIETIPYEILTNMSERVKRVYFSE